MKHWCVAALWIRRQFTTEKITLIGFSNTQSSLMRNGIKVLRYDFFKYGSIRKVRVRYKAQALGATFNALNNR